MATNTAGGYADPYPRWPGYAATGRVPIITSGTPIWRGFGAGMTPLMALQTGSAVRAVGSRQRFNCNKSFRRFRLVYSVFYQTTLLPFNDTLFAGDLDGVRIKAAFEFPFTLANSGIPAGRPVVTFDGGASSRVYTAATHDTTTGYVISDIFDIGQWVPANANFGLWTAYDMVGSGNWPAGGALIDSRLLARFQSGVNSAVSLTSEGGGTDWCTATASITPLSSGTSAIGPACMLIETESGTECIGINGDSMSNGTGEGAQDFLIGDTAGNAQCRRGVFERGIQSNYPDSFYVNVGRGTDRAEYQGKNDTNSQYRHELLGIAGCHTIINNMGGNDLGNTTQPTAFATAHAYAVADTITANGNIYMCIVAGTSLGSGTGPTGTGIRIENGTAQFRYLSATGTADNARVMHNMANLWNMNRLMKKAAGRGSRIIQALIFPHSIQVANGGAIPGDDQTPDTFASQPRRPFWNGFLRAIDTSDPYNAANIDAILDLNAFCEYQWPSPTDLWDCKGVAFGITTDFLHANSAGHAMMATKLKLP
jgi:hypothetical protein